MSMVVVAKGIVDCCFTRATTTSICAWHDLQECFNKQFCRGDRSARPRRFFTRATIPSENDPPTKLGSRQIVNPTTTVKNSSALSSPEPRSGCTCTSSVDCLSFGNRSQALKWAAPSVARADDCASKALDQLLCISILQHYFSESANV